MILDTDGIKPIYIQIADWIEEEIWNGNFAVDEKVFSQYKLADLYNINPATAAKGLTRLAEEEILYDKRGLGKFVSGHARHIILEKRKNRNIEQLAADLVREGRRLEMTEDELVRRIKEHWGKGE